MLGNEGIIFMTEKPMGRPRRNPIQIDESGNRYVEESVISQSNTGRVYVPSDWVGLRVRVTLLDK